MADLKVILASGDIEEIKVAQQNVVHEGSFRMVLEEALSDGISIPVVESADAGNGAIFFDPTAGQIRYKSPAGILLRFRMQLI